MNVVRSDFSVFSCLCMIRRCKTSIPDLIAVIYTYPLTIFPCSDFSRYFLHVLASAFVLDIKELLYAWGVGFILKDGDKSPCVKWLFGFFRSTLFFLLLTYCQKGSCPQKQRAITLSFLARLPLKEHTWSSAWLFRPIKFECFILCRKPPYSNPCISQ